MQRHTPVHPLPEEIRKMSRDETVCKYCGVSYLILHEFKLLEEKVKMMEEKVKFYEGSIEREKILQEKLYHLSQDFEQCTADSASKTERIKILSVDLENKQTAVQSLNEQLKCLHKEKNISYKESQVLRRTMEQYKFILKKAFAFLPFIREEVNSVKEGILGFFKELIVLKGQIFLQIKTTNVTTLAEISSLNKSLGECQRENVVLQEKLQHLRLISDVAELEAQKHQASLVRESELRNRCHELQKKIQDLTSHTETIELKFQKADAEMNRYKELFIKKANEVEDHQSKLKKLATEIQMSESRYERQQVTTV